MNSDGRFLKLILALVWVLSAAAHGQVRLPRLLSDGMVLQRDADITIWGWSSPAERISVHFLDSSYTTSADSSGNWKVALSALKAGGPYEMQVIGKDSVTIREIMIGDVWVCSGQSNMELPMKRVSPTYEREIASSANPYIRQFLVPQTYDFNAPHNDLQSASWKAANPVDVLEFSAAGYFFAKALYDKYKVPIGIVNASLGGSPIQSWMSEEALKSFPSYYHEAQRFKDGNVIKQIEEEDNARIRGWYSMLRQNDRGYKDPRKPWSGADVKTSGWLTMKVPGYWSNTKLGQINGVVWFRRTFRVPLPVAGKEAKLILGRIVDADSVFVNGAFVGTTSYQYPPRRYDIPSGLLKVGGNCIVVRVISNEGRGGFVLDKPYEIRSGNVCIDLKGKWFFRLGCEMKPLASQTFIRWKPLGLYNAMIAPLLKYHIKGVAWYQGESNAGRPLEYRELLPALIRDWRRAWNQGDFPFLFVQLPNFMEAKKEPTESNWAVLRESQLRTLAMPNTGMAVTCDIGEWNDVHPIDKKDVGTRLALAAEKVAYGDTNIVSSGPVFRSMGIEGHKIVIRFTNTGSGLVARGGGKLKYFAIAGADKHFRWADAKIQNEEVVVWSDSISKPVAVRYAWADNPEGANLYNKEGLPASPFRTDDWNVPQ